MKYAQFSDDFLSDFRLDDNGETLVLNDKRGYTRAVKLLPEAIVHCKDCKHQKKWWREDKRMKDKGYWIYGCNLIDDSFVGTPVWGDNNQFCSSAEPKGGTE